ncbi:Striatin-3 [Trichoplax sp. H2]|nr:Striatin-3 [Trichoplax sp. H2]|eukprot:RDD39346.1 Striatin-3 [Trichoplax sp. H2]
MREENGRIAFLQGERRAQENLKNDLVRRIKMLEYALKQERTKFHKLKYGTDLKFEDSKADAVANEEEKNAGPLPNEEIGDLTWRQGRQLLRQYLHEIGYTDTILEVRSARVRSLMDHLSFGKATSAAKDESNKGKPEASRKLNETQPSYDRADNMIAADDESAGAEDTIMSEFNFLAIEDDSEENGATYFEEGGNDDDDNVDGLPTSFDDIMFDNSKDASIAFMRTAESGTDDSMITIIEDAMAVSPEEAAARALDEFNFLVAEDNEIEADESTADKNAAKNRSEKLGLGNLEMQSEWNVDASAIEKLKEQYKKERKSKKVLKRPTRSSLQAMLVNLGEDEGSFSSKGFGGPGGDFGNPDMEQPGLRGVRPFSASKPIVLGDESVEGAISLGDLAGLSISNEAEALNNESASSGIMPQHKTWTLKYTLRSHFDCVRSLAFHPYENLLVSASDDQTLKLWNLQQKGSKRNMQPEIEPLYTYRGHRIEKGSLPGHTDAVWSIAVHPDSEHIISCSADGTCKLWRPGTLATPLIATFTANEDDGIPTSVTFLRNDCNQMAVSYTSSQTIIFDLHTAKPILRLNCAQSYDGTLKSQINKITSHPTLPLLITGHEDRFIRFFDTNSSQLVHSITAHMDAVTSLAIDPNGLYLISGSHDCSIRLWNIERKSCIQEMTAHRRKFDESVHDVAFHPSKPFVASSGADSVVKVYV